MSEHTAENDAPRVRRSVLTEQDEVIYLDPKTMMPVGVSKPCPETTIATLGFRGLSGVRVPCGNLAGHDGPHVFHVEWTTPIPPVETPDPVSRVEAVEAAEDRAEQAAYDVARERGL